MQKVEITVRRPDGTVETIISKNISYITPSLWERVKAATAKAGRGKCLSYRNIDDAPPAMNEAEIERQKILAMYDRAANARDYPETYLGLLREADKARAAWRAKYPEAAQVADRQALLGKAAVLRSKAEGALTYDSDGWLDTDARQARHDEYIREAEALEAQAKGI